jgi:hypothetical protein
MAEPRTIDVSLPGGQVAFSTRRGGVSEGPYESLNLGILTDDDQSRVAENRGLLASDVGLDQRSASGIRRRTVAGTRRRARTWRRSMGTRRRCPVSGCSFWWPTACRWR